MKKMKFKEILFLIGIAWGYAISGCSPDSGTKKSVESLDGLQYTRAQAVYSISTLIQDNRPRLRKGAAIEYFIHPALPRGLSLDRSSGIIRGTPEERSELIAYTVTATNHISSARTTLEIAVNGVQKFCVTDGWNDKAFFLDVSNLELKPSQSLAGGSTPLAVAYGKKAFAVLCQDSKNVTFFDALTHQIKASVDVEQTPRCAAFGNDRFAVCNYDSVRTIGRVSMIDANDYNLLKHVTVGHDPSAVAYGNKKFMVVNKSENGVDPGTVTIIDADTLDVLDTVVVGENPVAVAFGRDMFAVVNNGNNNTLPGSVSIIDAKTHAVSYTLAVKENPVSVAFGNNRFAVVNNGAYISNPGSVTIVDLDASTKTYTKTLQRYPTHVQFGKGRFGMNNERSDTVSVLKMGSTSSTDEIVHVSVSSSPFTIVFGSGWFLSRHYDLGEALLIDPTLSEQNIVLSDITLRVNYSEAEFSVPSPLPVFCVAESSENKIVIVDAFRDGIVKKVPLPVACVEPCRIVLGNDKFAVANRFSNDLVLVDAKIYEVLTDPPLSVGDTPVAIGFGENRFCVVNQVSKNVTLIDAVSNVVLSNTNVHEEPQGIAFGNGKFAITHEDGTIFFIEAATGNVVGTQAIGTIAGPIAWGNGKFAATSVDTENMYVMDAATHQILATPKVGYLPVAVAFGNGRFAVLNQDMSPSVGTVTIIDANDYRVLKGGIPVGRMPVAIVFGDNRFAILNRESENVTLINAQSNEVVKTCDVGQYPNDIAFVAHRFAVTNETGYSVTIIDAIQMKTVADIYGFSEVSVISSYDKSE